MALAEAGAPSTQHSAGEELHVSAEGDQLVAESLPQGEKPPAVVVIKRAWAEEKSGTENKPVTKTANREASAHHINSEPLATAGEAARSPVDTKSSSSQQKQNGESAVRPINSTSLLALKRPSVDHGLMSLNDCHNSAITRNTCI